MKNLYLHSIKRLFFIFDLLVLATLFVFGHYLSLSFGQKGWAMVLLALLIGYGMAYRNAGVYFDYYMYVIKIYAWALLFAWAYFILVDQWTNLALGFVYFTLWGLLSTLFRVIMVRKGMAQKRFLSPAITCQSSIKHMKLSIDPLTSPEGTDFREYAGLIIQKTYEYPEEWRRLIMHCQVVGIPVMTEEEVEERLHGRVSFEDLQRSWISNSFSFSYWYSLFKRIFDLAFVIILFPVWGLLAAGVSVAILITMGRPVIFAQERMGQGGERFWIYKFRTMTNGFHTHETTDQDQRITRLGNFLRRYRLDEIPQFINILKGEMSLIGPRPEWVLTAEKFAQEIPVYQVRHLVKPGITGWAQVNQGHAIGVEGNYQKLRYDLYYVKNFSFWLDVKIILKTITTVLTGFGAR